MFGYYVLEYFMVYIYRARAEEEIFSKRIRFGFVVCDL